MAINSVSDLNLVPKVLQEQILTNVEGALVEKALFRDLGENTSGLIEYTVDPIRGLKDGYKPVAEFGEIPVTQRVDNETKVAKASKLANALRVSYEMLKAGNAQTQINEDVAALQEEWVRGSATQSWEAFEKAGVKEIQVATPWSKHDTAKVTDDVYGALEEISGASAYDGLYNYGYVADTILVHPSQAQNIFRASDVQKYYVGNNADQNPVYKGTLDKTAFGLTIVTSRFVPLDSAIVLESQKAGFISEQIPFQITPFYNEGAPESINTFGPTMSKRADAVVSRALAVDKPKSAVILKGLKG